MKKSSNKRQIRQLKKKEWNWKSSFCCFLRTFGLTRYSSMIWAHWKPVVRRKQKTLRLVHCLIAEGIDRKSQNILDHKDQTPPIPMEVTFARHNISFQDREYLPPGFNSYSVRLKFNRQSCSGSIIQERTILTGKYCRNWKLLRNRAQLSVL